MHLVEKTIDDMTTFGVAAQTIQKHMWHTQQQEQRTHYARSKPSTAAHTAQLYFTSVQRKWKL